MTKKKQYKLKIHSILIKKSVFDLIRPLVFKEVLGTHGQIRIRGGRTSEEGRVEIKIGENGKS